MKTLGYLTLALFLSTNGNVFAADNYSDDLDANNTEAVLEDRKSEIGNTVDSVDYNNTPAQLEERQKEEKFESDSIQADDAEKSYDYLDKESDEF